MKKYFILPLAVIALTGCNSEPHPSPVTEVEVDHAAMGHGSSNPGVTTADSAATLAYKDANDAMHRDMAVQFTGDPDADFVAAMIPHHEGAVTMTRIALEPVHF